MANIFVLVFMGLVGLVLMALACLIVTRVLVILCEFIEAVYKCIFPDGTPNILNFGCCCCDIRIDCSWHRGLQTPPSYRPVYIIRCFTRLCNKINFHCCNQWGCMAKHFNCRCCRKSIQKIVPVKKNYTDRHIIVINPFDNQYKIGTLSKVTPL